LATPQSEAEHKTVRAASQGAMMLARYYLELTVSDKH